MHTLRVLCGAAMLAACLAPAAHADEWNKLTYFTFSGPLEMPGIVLPAGSYKFELADPDSTRRLVRVSDKEGTKVHGTFLSISNQMMEPADKPLVMFKESPAGAPEAVKAWFYPGETIGYEFVYPHDQALKLAKATHSTVLTAKGEVTGTTLAADTTRIDENDRVVSATTTADASASKPATASASTSTTASTATTAEAATSTTAASTTQQAPPAPVTSTASAAAAPAPTTTAETAAPPAPPATTTTAQAVEAPATVAPQPVTTPRETTIPEPAAAVATAAEAPAPSAPRRDLPNTASPLPLMELFSGLAIAGGFALRALRKALA